MLNNVYGNYATNNGWGSYLNNSINTTISGSVYGNSATNGGGVFLRNSDYFTNIGWITNNHANTTGGGVYTNTSHPNSYLGVGRVINNIPNNFN